MEAESASDSVNNARHEEPDCLPNSRLSLADLRPITLDIGISRDETQNPRSFHVMPLAPSQSTR